MMPVIGGFALITDGSSAIQYRHPTTASLQGFPNGVSSATAMFDLRVRTIHRITSRSHRLDVYSCALCSGPRSTFVCSTCLLARSLHKINVLACV